MPAQSITPLGGEEEAKKPGVQSLEIDA